MDEWFLASHCRRAWRCRCNCNCMQNKSLSGGTCQSFPLLQNLGQGRLRWMQDFALVQWARQILILSVEWKTCYSLQFKWSDTNVFTAMYCLPPRENAILVFRRDKQFKFWLKLYSNILILMKQNKYHQISYKIYFYNKFSWRHKC